VCAMLTCARSCVLSTLDPPVGYGFASAETRRFFPRLPRVKLGNKEDLLERISTVSRPQLPDLTGRQASPGRVEPSLARHPQETGNDAMAQRAEVQSRSGFSSRAQTRTRACRSRKRSSCLHSSPAPARAQFGGAVGLLSSSKMLLDAPPHGSCPLFRGRGRPRGGRPEPSPRSRSLLACLPCLALSLDFYVGRGARGIVRWVKAVANVP